MLPMSHPAETLTALLVNRFTMNKTDQISSLQMPFSFDVMNFCVIGMRML